MPTVTKTKEASAESASSGARTLRRQNAAALEVTVNVSGSKQNGGEKRGLFSEETCTVLVFEEGAVIRLEADVTVGQLLFLTENKTKREVVCEVVHKRESQGSSCYVELEFTERMENFWGRLVPEGPKRASKRTELNKVGEKSQGTPREALKNGEMQELKSEVATLKAQLREVLDAKTVEGTRAQEAKQVDLERKITREREAGVLAELARGEKRRDSNEEEATESGAVQAGAAKLSNNIAAESWKGRDPDEGKAREEGDSSDDLPATPDLEFLELENETQKPTRKGIGKPGAAILGVVLIAAIGAGTLAWYENWLAFLPHTNTKEMPGTTREKANSAGEAAGKPTSTATSGGGSGIAAGAANQVESNAVKKAAGQAADTKSEGVKEAVSTPATGGEVEAKPGNEQMSSELPDPVKALSGKKVERRHGEAQTSAAPEATEKTAGEAGSETVEVAPRLVKAVNPEYPPDAMREYITGDVRVEAAVGANGKVGAVKAISGPAALQAAAIDAVKQYEYAAATRDGKAVAGKVTVMVKFWFTP